jgi:hypothetical protein
MKTVTCVILSILFVRPPFAFPTLPPNEKRKRETAMTGTQ